MADTAINITAGSGTAVDTRTEATNGNHRQVIVIGDPSTNAGVAPVDVTKGLAVDLTATGANTNAIKVNIASGGVASGGIASGAVASGAVASGAFASGAVGSGAIASGAVASGAVASGAFAVGSIADGADVTLGAKADAKSSATDTTAITLMSVAKQLSAELQLLRTALGSTALDLGVSTGGTRTLRMAIDSSQVQATVSHDGADSGDPLKIGGRARSSEITAVSNNDRSDLLTDLVGKLIVLPYANPENFVSGAITSAMTGTTSTSLIAAPAAGLRNYITQITVSCAHATQGTDIIIQDGSGGTTLYTIPAAALYGGAVVTFPVPLRQPTTATAIFCANVTTSSSTKVSASGYKGV